MKEYNKIETVFKRDELGTKKLIEGDFRSKEVEYLKDNQWIFTEKIDGTNIRVYWNGHKVIFSGRTDNSQIPSKLVEKLNELFSGNTNEELFEQKFGDKEVIFYGEGFGGNIQGNLGYKEEFDFILFDVCINNTILDKDSCIDLAKSFGINYVPVVFEGTIQEAIDYVKTEPKSKIGSAKMEGLVGRPQTELFDKLGNRIIVKIKVRDFV